MEVRGFNKTTLLDYPKHIAATIFLSGCNYRCPFCHNASLVMNPDSQPLIPTEEVFSVLEKRRHILEGVCITGGEPTIYKDLPLFIHKIKDLGYKVKLDTNGNNPTMLRSLVEDNLLDYVAMDIKNSLAKYGTTVGILNFKTDKVEASAKYLMTNIIPYEFRTTVVKELHEADDFVQISLWLKGCSSYYLQNYIDSGDTIFPGLTGCTKEELLYFKSLLKSNIPSVELRGID